MGKGQNSSRKIFGKGCKILKIAEADYSAHGYLVVIARIRKGFMVSGSICPGIFFFDGKKPSLSRAPGAFFWHQPKLTFMCPVYFFRQLQIQTEAFLGNIIINALPDKAFGILAIFAGKVKGSVEFGKQKKGAETFRPFAGKTKPDRAVMPKRASGPIRPAIFVLVSGQNFQAF